MHASPVNLFYLNHDYCTWNLPQIIENFGNKFGNYLLILQSYTQECH
jgi:hypothetical protein